MFRIGGLNDSISLLGKYMQIDDGLKITFCGRRTYVLIGKDLGDMFMKKWVQKHYYHCTRLWYIDTFSFGMCHAWIKNKMVHELYNMDRYADIQTTCDVLGDKTSRNQWSYQLSAIQIHHISTVFERQGHSKGDCIG